MFLSLIRPTNCGYTSDGLVECLVFCKLIHIVQSIEYEVSKKNLKRTGLQCFILHNYKVSY